MKILFYIPYISQQWGGVKQYTCNLLELFKELPLNYDIYVYHESNDKDVLAIIESNTHFKLVDSNHLAFNKFYRLLTYILKFIAGFFLSKKKVEFSTSINQFNIANRLVTKYKIQILHVPYQSIPVVANVKTICTMHDVQQIHFPDFFSKEELLYRQEYYTEFLNNSNLIIVSYRHIKNDIVKYFNINNNKIQILLLQMNKLWFNKFSENDIIQRNKLNIPESYLLYPANAWPHKNHMKLIEAIKKIKDNNGNNINVVLTGNHSTPLGSAIKAKITMYGLDNCFLNLGIVSDEVLFSLYKNATGVVIPTLYEAGSFPLMESILMGIPVICSNVTSLPETINNNEFIFDPNDVEDIANKIHKLYYNNEFRTESVSNSRRVKHAIINTNALENLVFCYNKVLSN
jgi:glycosyltransferase involved in cell wall biosynthesis